MRKVREADLDAEDNKGLKQGSLCMTKVTGWARDGLEKAGLEAARQLGAAAVTQGSMEVVSGQEGGGGFRRWSAGAGQDLRTDGWTEGLTEGRSSEPGFLS